jgi:anti-sigma B factor antagonist
MSVQSPGRVPAVVERELPVQLVGLAPASTPVPLVYFELHVDYATREIDIRGEFDCNTASCLATAVTRLQRAARADITVRLDDLTFIDAAGIGAVAGANTAQTHTGAHLRLTGVTARARRVFTLGGLGELLHACQQDD